MFGSQTAREIKQEFWPQLWNEWPFGVIKRDSWAFAFKAWEKQNKTTLSVGIIKSEFLKRLKKMSSCKNCASTGNSLRNVKVPTVGLPLLAPAPAPSEPACKRYRGSNLKQVQSQWHQSKGSYLSSRQVTEVSPLIGQSSPALCQLPFPQFVHICADFCTLKRKMIYLIVVGTSMSFESESCNGSHR